MILSMEIGDKTFFIGAILAMTHNRWLVFLGSVLALVVMCVISCAIGLAAPILMSRELSVVVASVLVLLRRAFHVVCFLRSSHDYRRASRRKVRFSFSLSIAAM